MAKICFIYLTASSKKEAERIAKTLLLQKLAACCNIFKMESFYWWRKEIERSEEYGMVVKTRKVLVGKIIKTIKKIHSYSIPCIVSFDVKEGNKEFLDWIEKATK